VGLIVLALALSGCMHKHSGEQATVMLAFFHPWSADLTPEAKVVVDQAAAKIKDTKPSTVTIAGYTYNDADPEANRRLATQRVAAVRNALISDGIDPKLFLDIPVGAPKESTSMTGDRRVEIRLNYGG
jgi:outer membrane protein OmpA-like peptidoglycan-associated protein